MTYLLQMPNRQIHQFIQNCGCRFFGMYSRFIWYTKEYYSRFQNHRQFNFNCTCNKGVKAKGCLEAKMAKGCNKKKKKEGAKGCLGSPLQGKNCGRYLIISSSFCLNSCRQIQILLFLLYLFWLLSRVLDMEGSIDQKKIWKARKLEFSIPNYVYERVYIGRGQPLK